MQDPAPSAAPERATPDAPPARRRLPARYRWYLAILGLGLLYLGGKYLYEMLLPAPIQVNRGWQAIQIGCYDDARRAFDRARRQRPDDPILPIAYRVAYYHEWRDEPLMPRRFEILALWQPTREWMAPHELHWRDAKEVAACAWLARQPWPKQGYRTLGIACKLFDLFWIDHPGAVRQALAGIDAFQRDDMRAAWRALDGLRADTPKVFARFALADPLLLRLCAIVAARDGHAAEARALARQYRQCQPFYIEVYDENIWGKKRIDPAGDPDDALPKP